MLNVGLIGCGNIAETYFRSQEYFNNINFVSCTDINEEAAKKCADKYNIKLQSVDDLLSNPDIDVILNLTVPQAHHEVTKKYYLLVNTHTVKNPYPYHLNKERNLWKLQKKKIYI